MRAIDFALMAIVFSVGSACSKDLSFVQQVATTGLPEYQETAFFAGNKAGRDGQHQRVIVDVQENTMTLANKDERTVTVTPLERIRGSAEGVTLKATGKASKISGYEAREFAIEGAGLSGSLWLAEGFDIGPDTREWALRAGALSAKVPVASLVEAVVKEKGFPLRSRVTASIGPTNLEVTTEVIKVLEGAVPSDLLSVPQGFTAAGKAPEAKKD